MQNLEEKRLFLQDLDELLHYCLKNQITDLHFEPQDLLRLRHQGHLKIYPHLHIDTLRKITQRFKVMAKLDISSIRRPQDGQFLWTSPAAPHPIPCRISCCPTLNGEKIVVRLLLRSHLKLNWTNLGLNGQQQATIEAYVQINHGLILVNGPTGSGKTTTLYTLLEKMNTGKQHIVSIEDPIEIPYLSFTQVEVQPDLGFSLKHCLRTVLRQDPDIIMIGEIRDTETAKLCMEAAQTGHLVLSSLHSYNAEEAIRRLCQLGIAQHDISHFLKLVITQHFLPHTAKPQFELFEFHSRPSS